MNEWVEERNGFMPDGYSPGALVRVNAGGNWQLGLLLGEWEPDRTDPDDPHWREKLYRVLLHGSTVVVTPEELVEVCE